MTDKELAKYVLTHNLVEVVKLCTEIINEDKVIDNNLISSGSIPIEDIPNISRKMIYNLKTSGFDNVGELLDKEHIKVNGSWWYMRGIGKESLMPVMVYLYKNELIKNENTINQSFFELYQYCIHQYLKKELLEEPKKINSDLNENERLMSLDLMNTKLPKRGKTILSRHNVNTIGELLKISNNELLNLPQLGWKTYNDILKSLKENYGLELK